MKDETKKINKNREKKEKIVAELSEKVKKAKALVFTNYTGMTHVQLEHLKKAVKKVDAEIVVTKNTLLKRSLENSNFQLPASPAGGSTFSPRGEAGNFQLPTATLFSYGDVIAPLKELARTIKSLKLPLIKFGIFEGKNLTAEEILKLSVLPSREVLLSQLVFAMKSPIYGLHRALNWNMRKLVMTIKAISDKQKAISGS